MRRADYRIRRATPADAAAIAAAHADSIRSIGPRYYVAEIVAAWGSGLTSELYVDAMKSGETFWIAAGTEGDRYEVLGFSSHRIDDDEHGVSVYVRGECARQGIGSALLGAAEARARRMGAGRITIAASLAAVDFYRAHGFDEVGRGEHRLRSGQPMACVFMRKAVPVPKRVRRGQNQAG